MKLNLGFLSIEIKRNRFTPIDNINQAWRFWSVRLSVFCGMLFAFLAAVPDAVLWAWTYLPAEMKGLVPEQYVSIATMLLFILNVVLRLAKQDKKEVENADKEEFTITG